MDLHGFRCLTSAITATASDAPILLPSTPITSSTIIPVPFDKPDFPEDIIELINLKTSINESWS